MDLIYSLLKLTDMEKLFLANEATLKVANYNSSINNSVHFLKELTHGGNVKFETFGFTSVELNQVSDFIDFLQSKKIANYDLIKYLQSL
jgi:hypothetical protein